MRRELPRVKSTKAERLAGLQSAKPLLAAGGIQSAFSSPAPYVDHLIRLAEYIVTGHDYDDTHPIIAEEPK